MAGEVAAPETGLLGASVKYNPHLWGASELRAIFVVRQGELQRLQAALRAAKPDSAPQHILITGQRGMGKSTLLQRLALAVREDETLRVQWVPLTFPEEQYTVSTLAEFWRDVLDALADALQREGAVAEEIAALDRKISALGDMPTAQREESALETLTSWVREHRRGVLLLIDSTDQLFSALGTSAHGAKAQAAKGKNARRATKAGSTALWRLRKALSHETGIFWIEASYQALEASDLYHDTFHDFFELLELRPLSLAEMRTAMLALARVFGAGRGLDGEAAVAEITRTLDARPERLHALRALTGGNPRTTVMLYELLSAASDDHVHGDITRLLDLMTPLYKARMESLADQPRKILAHLLEHWAPIAVGDLARISGIPNTTVSGQLARLEADGLIEKTRLHGTTRSGYQASERFFNVWYLMRYAARRLRQRLSWLIEFMRLWYGRDELAMLASTRASRHAKGLLGDVSSLEYSRAMAAALSEREDDRLQLEWAVDSAAAEQACRHAIDLAPTEASPWRHLGAVLSGLSDRYDEAEAAYRKAIELDPESDEPWIGLGNLLEDHLKHYDDAEAAYRRAMTLDSTRPEPVARLARLLAFRGQREAALAMYRQTIDRIEQQRTSADKSAPDFQDVLLQAHLWLGNRDLAARALDSLARLASGGDEQAFALLREQVRECSRIGLSAALADRMDASEYAGFLQPLSLALRAAAPGGEIPAGAAPEITALAEEVFRELVER